MAIERTLSIIKPDATRRNLTGEVNARLEKAGLRVIAQKRLWLSRAQAEKFYEVHKARPFYNDLCTFMTSGPVVVQVLEGENAVARNREIMGRPIRPRRRRGRSGAIWRNPSRPIPCMDRIRGECEGEIAFFFAGIEIVG
jgi:nucleoside-diphosphate kinase